MRRAAAQRHRVRRCMVAVMRSRARESEENKTKVLVKHLDRYAEIGSAYVTKLENLIRTNQFGRYALAYLN